MRPHPVVLSMAFDRENIEDAKAAALRALEARMRTRREIRDRLNRRGYTDAVVTRVLTDFERAGLLDDRNYARIYIENRQRTRPRGYALLKAELLRKGIAPNLAAEAVLEARAERAEMEIAREVLAKAASRFASLPPDARRRRAASFLKSRGFGSDTMQALLGEALEET